MATPPYGINGGVLGQFMPQPERAPGILSAPMQQLGPGGTPMAPPAAMGAPPAATAPLPQQPQGEPPILGPEAYQPVAEPMVDETYLKGIGEEALSSKFKKPGLLDRIRDKPGGNEALLAFGAQMLSAPNFWQGMGQGITAYSNTLRQAKMDARPKVESIAGGAYTSSTNPETGETTYTETPAAQFLKDKAAIPVEGRIKTTEMTEAGKKYRTELEEKGRNERSRYETDTKRDIAELVADTQTDIAQMRSETAETVAKIGADGKAHKGPNSGITKQVTELVNVRDGLGNALTTIAPTLEAIRSGALTFDVLSNARHKIALGTGVGGNAQTQQYAQFQQQLEQLRNALLLANKGVQTDGDADRAMAELIAGRGDTRSVQANLNVVYRSLRMRMGQANGRILDISEQQGANISHSQAGAYNGQTVSTPQKTSTGIKWRKVQ